MMTLSFSAVLLLSFLLPGAKEVLVSAACYYPNGTNLNNPEYQACPNSGVCCALNRSNPSGGDQSKGPVADECLSNGLCEQNHIANGQPKRSWWRDFCADSNWNKSTCLSICMTGNLVDLYGNIKVTPCDGTRLSEKWCCGETTDCCNRPDAIVLAQTLGAAPPIMSSSTSRLPSTSAPTTVATGGPPSTPSPKSPEPTGSNGLSTGAKAGIGVGAAVGAIALVVVVFIWSKSSQRKKVEASNGDHAVEIAAPPYTEYKQTAELHVEPGELYMNAPVHELPAEKTD